MLGMLKYFDGTKLEPKSDKCLFVGYARETKRYYLYNLKENKIFVALHVVFLRGISKCSGKWEENRTR